MVTRASGNFTIVDRRYRPIESIRERVSTGNKILHGV